MVKSIKEQWKTIPGYPGYKINNLGVIISYKRYPEGKEIQGAPDKDGYNRLILYSAPHTRKAFRRNRLVAQAFVHNPHPDKWKIVNHKDEDVTNDRADNLEWCDVEYNNNYGTKKERTRITNIETGNFVKVTAYKDGEYLYFESMQQCHRELGMSTSDIMTLVSSKPGENYKGLKSLKGWQIVKQGNERFINKTGVNSRPVSRRLVCYVEDKYEVYFPSRASAARYFNLRESTIRHRANKNLIIDGLTFKYV